MGGRERCAPQIHLPIGAMMAFNGSMPDGWIAYSAATKQPVGVLEDVDAIAV